MLGPNEKTPKWGVNFSAGQMRYMGIDPKEGLLEILKELKPEGVRLMAYWDEIEKTRGSYDFSEINWQLDLAEKYRVPVILVIGKKQPRWPECHTPEWFKNLDENEDETAVSEMLVRFMEEFRERKIVKYWQVENEPFFPYGQNCPTQTMKEIRNEIATVRLFDKRPVLLTDSGEKGDWIRTGILADIFGSTMYRTVHNPKWGGYITYPLPGVSYRIKAGLLKIFNWNLKFVGIELQAEPWFNGNVWDIPLNEQKNLMNAEILKKNAEYARQSGFEEHYFWGVEWWLWLKEHKGDESAWEAGKRIIDNR